MKRCVSCSKPNPDNAKRCFYCKADISEAIPENISETVSETHAENFNSTDFQHTAKEFSKDIASKTKAVFKNICLIPMIISILIGILLAADFFTKKSYIISVVCLLSGILLSFAIHGINKLYIILERMVNKD